MAKENSSPQGNATEEKPPPKTESIWFEVANVRSTGKYVEIQLKGERTDREPAWLTVDTSSFESPDKAYRSVIEGLDKKRIVLAELIAAGQTIECRLIRVQYVESASR